MANSQHPHPGTEQPAERTAEAQLEAEGRRREVTGNLISFLVLLGVVVVFRDRLRDVIVFVLTLGILIAVHEWGHFIAARSVGVRVYEFALGMGPRLFTYMRRHGTEFTVRILPIGGFVNPRGMQPEDPITADGINGRRPAERALVYLAGPMMNMVLAVAVLCLRGFAVGSPDPSQILVGPVDRKKAGDQMEVIRKNGSPVSGLPKGLRTGDHVLAVNGDPVDRVEELIYPINSSAGKPLEFTVRRGRDVLVLRGVPTPHTLPARDRLQVSAAPEAPGALPVRPGDELEELDGKNVDRGPGSREFVEQLLREKAGLQLQATVWRPGEGMVALQGTAVPLALTTVRSERTIGRLYFVPVTGQGPRMSLGASVQAGLEQVWMNLTGFARLFSRPRELQGNVGGIITIGALIGQVGSLPLIYWCNLLGNLSISLAVFNLLPIPLLDGGHLMVLTWETIRRRRLDAEAHRKVQMVGLAIIGMLFLAIMWTDIVRHFL
jgi:regulator of sigma E protease